MPSPPYAKLLVRLDGGAPLSGGITSASVGQVAQLSIENVTGATEYRWEIYDFPDDFALPSGWSEAGDGRYYSTAPIPGPFTISHWGDYALALYVNGGGREKLEDVYNTVIRVVSPNGLVDISSLEKQQFHLRGWPVGQKANLRLLDVKLGSGINVKSAPYNATGNGTADDSAAILAAIAAAEAGGGTVVFPAGTYNLGTTTITLSGTDVTLHLEPGATLSRASATGDIVQLQGSRNGIRGGTITRSIAGSGDDSVDITGTDCFVEGVRFLNAATGIYCFEATRVSLRKNTIIGAAFRGIRFYDTAGFLCEGNTVTGCGSDGIEVGTGNSLGRVVGNNSHSNTGQDLKLPDIEIASGVATIPAIVDGAAYELHPESGAYDVLTDISGVPDGASVTVFPDAGDTILVDHAAGNLRAAGTLDFAMVGLGTSLTFRRDAANGFLYETARASGSTALREVAGTTSTLTVEDCNRSQGVASTGGSATEFTIDQVSGTPYPVGAMVPVAQLGTGALTIGATAAATLNGSSGAAVVALPGQYSSLVLHHVSTNNWVTR